MYLKTKTTPEYEAPVSVPQEAWRKALLDAAEYIRQHGLAKFEQLDSKGRACLHGAISLVVTGEPYRDDHPTVCKAERAVCNYLAAKGAQGVCLRTNGAARWNNASRRTKEQVISALEAAARS